MKAMSTSTKGNHDVILTFNNVLNLQNSTT